MLETTSLEEILEQNAEALSPKGIGQKHQVSVISDLKSDGNGGFTYDFIRKTDLPKVLMDRGFINTNYVHAIFRMEDTVDGALVVGEDVHKNVFANEGPAFEHIVTFIVDGNYHVSPVDYVDRRGVSSKKLILNTPFYGESVRIIFPRHYITDDNGRRIQSTSFIGGTYVDSDATREEVAFFFFPMSNRRKEVERYFRRYVEGNIVPLGK